MKIQAILWIVFLTLLILLFQGCEVGGSTGPAGAPGIDGTDGLDGVIVEIPAEIEEGLNSGLACLEAALPDFYLKSLHIHEDKEEIHIKLKEIEDE